MKRNSIKLLSAAILLATGQQAFAAATGTLAGQVVTNTASVVYTVNTVQQTAAINDPNAAFTVDRKVNVTVDAHEPTTGPKGVAPLALNQMLTFTVTNTTNDTMDFDLSTLDAASGDDFDVTSINNVYVDNMTPGQGTVGVYDAGIDTATSINDLASGDDITVFVFSDIPDLLDPDIADGKQSGIVLTATALTSAGVALPSTDDASSADSDDTVTVAGTPGGTAGTIQNVYADADGPGDGLHDRAHSDIGYYEIQTAAISVNKQSFVMWDPINNYTNPKAIPGAVLVYCITITNPSPTVVASAIGVSDVLDSNLDYRQQTHVALNDNNGIALTLSEDAANPSCDAATLIDASTDSSAGTAGDALYKVAAIPALDMRTDVNDGPDDGGYFDSGTSTLHADTPTLDAKAVGQDSVATTVFRVTIK